VHGAGWCGDAAGAGTQAGSASRPYLSNPRHAGRSQPRR
jgi:hypothetical protein